MLYIILMPISHFVFLIMTYYLLFILDYRNDVRQKQIWGFRSHSKLVVKQQRQLTISIIYLAQELLTNIQCYGGLRGFARERRALKIKVAVNGQLRRSLRLILLQPHKKLQKSSALTILQSFSIWRKLERWKSSLSWCLMNWPQIKQKIILKCHLLLL